MVRVQAGREGTVQTALVRRLKVAGKHEVVPRVLVPVETITEVKAGKKRTRKRKLYPGYVLVEVDEEKGKVPRDVWFLVRETAGVGDFVGPHGHPEPLDEKEVGPAPLRDGAERGEGPPGRDRPPEGRHGQDQGGPLRAVRGPVDEVIPEKGTVKVIVTIFGRPTPVELEYWEVEPV